MIASEVNEAKNKLVNIQNPWLKQSGLAVLFWNCRGIVRFEIPLADETIIANQHCDKLTYLNVAIQEKRPIFINRKVVIFYQDNARQHVAKYMLDKLNDLKWETLQQPY